MLPKPPFPRSVLDNSSTTLNLSIFTYDSIISAMKKGEMYSSMGPLFKEVSIEKNKIQDEAQK